MFLNAGFETCFMILLFWVFINCLLLCIFSITLGFCLVTAFYLWHASCNFIHFHLGIFFVMLLIEQGYFFALSCELASGSE
jgi:hypothetical protein